MGDVYNAANIVDKTLIAKKNVPVYEYPGDSKKPVGYIAAGDPVGVVYSYLPADPLDDRKTLWWMFHPATNYSKYFYAPHYEGLYDVNALKQQGVLSTEEELEEKELADLPWYERLIRKYGTQLAIGAGVVLLGSSAIKGYFSQKSKQ